MMNPKAYFILFSVLFLAHPEPSDPQDGLEKVKNLPLAITNALTEKSEMPAVLLISGDGGWYKFEQSIADQLARLGIPTIGLDSRKYFWQRRTPEETASDMAGALNYYGNIWGKNKFVLIGYSLGAELVPFIVNRLPANIRTSSIVLLSPATTTDFEIHVTNMMGIGNRSNTYDTVSEIVRMHSIPTLIIYGDGEKTTVPELLHGTSVVIKKIPGDHHYHSNVTLIVQTMNENNVF
jgi:type IV secretory pathway VirJ component